MSVSSQLFTALKGLVGNRCYPDTFMQPDGNLPVWPAIRYTVTGGDTFGTICGTSDGDEDTPSIQVDLVCATQASRETLTASVRTAMAAMATPTSLENTPTNEYDSETKTYRVRFDYLIHS